MELTTLVRERGSVKAALTRFKRFLNTLQTDSQESSQLETRLEAAISLFDKFNIVQNKIESSVTDDKLENEENERDKFEKEYFNVITEAKDRLRSSVEMPSNSLNQMRSSISKAAIKLPTIDLPSFDGAYEQYLYFRDTFEALIHKNNELTAVQKFHYLRAALKGNAASIIQSIELSNANYDEAWKLITKRYDNKRLLTNNHVKSLFNLQSLSRESFTGLRNLLDEVQKHIRALKVLEQPTEKWDCLIIYLITSKLDSITRRQWEEENDSNNLPTYDMLIKFLNNKCQILETLHASKPISNFENKGKSFVAISVSKCPKCKGDHYIQACPDFLKLSAETRGKEIQSLRLCLNCFRGGHRSKDCRGSNCRKCGKKHNTLLHSSSYSFKPTAVTLSQAQAAEGVATSSTQPRERPESISDSATVCVAQSIKTPAPDARQLQTNLQLHAFLSTAVVLVFDKDGKPQPCRVLLDNGSETNFISQTLCKELGIKTSNINFAVSGVSQALTKINQHAQIKVQSRINSFNKTLQCLVIPKISEKIPSVNSDSQIKIPSNIKLADPSFNNSSNVDLLIGVTTFYEIQCVGQIFLDNTIRLQKTLLRWVVSGPIYTNNNAVMCNLSVSHYNKTEYETLSNLNHFWELDEVDCPTINCMSQGESFCEDNFKQTTTRDKSGRYVVTLPLNKNVYDLGESKDIATKRLLSLERKLNANSELKQMYHEFMNEYLELGHMSQVDNNKPSEFEFYLPHHAVLRPDHTTTKLRVVFDGSSKTSSGVSLNDCQFVGPNIQNELFTILLRFRKYLFVLTADATKMYRQVFVNEAHRPLQKILWRTEPSQEIKSYELNTVTYGTSAASFLAIRALQQTAIDNKNDQPEAFRVIINDFYVDDLLTGSNSKDELIKLGQNVRDVLKTGGFELRKWASNNQDISKHFSHENESIVNLNNEIKALGICFKPSSDEIQYSINISDKEPISKRTILSNVAQIFDPLGILSPIITKAKLIIQTLWKNGLSWDESIPANLYSEWVNFRSKLPCLNHIKIPRRTICKNATKLEMHGFADASEKAYAACIYIRSQNSVGKWHVRLLCAKTKVAPMKHTTLPRLELCGCLLLAKLSNKVQKSLGIDFDAIFLWTDSSIALAWIKGDSARWQTFVANRTAQIQNLTTTQSWHHVSSKHNPADCATRGIYPDELLRCSLWWNVSWLSLNQTDWPVKIPDSIPIEKLPEVNKRTSTHLVITANEYESNLFTKYSSYPKLLRVTAYVLRFYFNLKHPKHKISGTLTNHEVDRAQSYIIRIIQHKHFHSEIDALSKNHCIGKQSKILTMAPFLDDDSILRVGGRLANSEFSYEKRHPALLPKNHPITKLITRHYHEKLLHCGPQLLLYSVREHFWPIDGKCMAKRIVHECIKCFRAKPRPTSYLMGQLPKVRTEISFPFTNTGTDYCGPFLIKTKEGRGSKVMKGYVCLFVCLTTKAIHLELVTSLSTDGFLAALKRFCARRGKCNHIYSDNGTNFVGANKELNNVLKAVSNSEFIASERITWHFIPPNAPHFGGIWEAGVRSVKHHLRRVMGDLSLTYENFTTVLCQVESILNSRPLSPLSCDPNDLSPLTPGHFLVGRALTSTPDANLINTASNRLSKYLQLQQLVQHFWKRWSLEYVSQLQARVKWKLTAAEQLKVDALVVVKDDNLPPLHWCLGRITCLHPGTDGVVRVVTVKCKNTTFKRPVSKICVLPLERD